MSVPLPAAACAADLLAWAESHYDQVLVDCPPIVAASDAAIVGRLTDSLILVVQPEKNHRRLVLRAVNGLAAVGCQIGGIVANRIRLDKNAGYYGYGGYGLGYGYGYNENPSDEDDESPRAATLPIGTRSETRDAPAEDADNAATSDSRKVKPRRAA